MKSQIAVSAEIPLESATMARLVTGTVRAASLAAQPVTVSRAGSKLISAVQV